MDERASSILKTIQETGQRAMVIGTTSSALPWAVVLIPMLPDLSMYTLEAQKDGPLMAAVRLFQKVARGFPEGVTLETVVHKEPFVILRIVQALLKDLGLEARAEKKSP